MPSLDLFSAPARAWFQSAFAAPTEVQELGWREGGAGPHTLMTAPTGSGKTLAAIAAWNRSGSLPVRDGFSRPLPLPAM